MLDENGVEFTIGNDTHFAYTTYGPFIALYVKNTPIKGKIEIFKSGEIFTAIDDSFNYDNTKSLEGIVYNIYADEDIKSLVEEINNFHLEDLLTIDENGYKICGYGILQTMFNDDRERTDVLER